MTKRMIGLVATIILVSIVSAQVQEGGANMKITSPEFKHNDYIPKKFTCQGEDINPALIMEDIPKEAKSLALIVDDPDAPMGTWIHWVVYDIAPVFRIEENSIPGKHTVLNLKEGISKSGLEKAMEGHILAKAELIGLYKKSK